MGFPAQVGFVACARREQPHCSTRTVRPACSSWSRDWEQSSAASRPPPLRLQTAGTCLWPMRGPSPREASYSNPHSACTPASPAAPRTPLWDPLRLLRAQGAAKGAGRWHSAQVAGGAPQHLGIASSGHLGGPDATSSDWFLVQMAISAWHFSAAGNDSGMGMSPNYGQ